MNKLLCSSSHSQKNLEKKNKFFLQSCKNFSIYESSKKTEAKDEKSTASEIIYLAAFLLALSAASFPEVSAQALFAPDGESVPITPPTTSPAAYSP